MNTEQQGIFAQPKKPGPITRAVQELGIAQMPILVDQRAAFASGGIVGLSQGEEAKQGIMADLNGLGKVATQPGQGAGASYNWSTKSAAEIAAEQASASARQPQQQPQQGIAAPANGPYKPGSALDPHSATANPVSPPIAAAEPSNQLQQGAPASNNSQPAATTFQQDIDARQSRIDGYASKLKGMESAARSDPNTLNAPYAGGIATMPNLSGFANGGKISGPGTPKSDSIPATVSETGEQIKVSTGERIVSHEQDQYLGKLAQSMGFDSLDRMLEAGTGKPVGPTIKSAQRAAAAGMAPDTDPDTDGRRQYSPAYGNAFTNRGGNSSAQGQHERLSAAIGAVNQGSDGVGKPEVKQQSGDHGVSQGVGIAAIQSSNPLTTKDILPGGYIDQGAGILAVRDKRGQLNVSNVGTEQLTDSSKTLYTDASGKGTNDWTQTAEYARGQRDAQNQRGQLATMQRDRLERDAFDPSITDPNVRANARAQIAEQDAMAGKAGEAQGRFLENQIKRTKLASDGAIAGLQTQYIAEKDSVRRDDIASQIRDVTGKERHSSDQEERLTLPQRRSNFEIEAARKAVSGLTPQEIQRKTAKTTNTGRENPDFDPTLERAMNISNRRKYGAADDWFDQRQQAQQPVGTDGDVTTRFRADKAMQGHKLGKQADRGYEVLDASGKVIGYWN